MGPLYHGMTWSCYWFTFFFDTPWNVFRLIVFHVAEC